jgi:hypothetical protein
VSKRMTGAALLSTGVAGVTACPVTIAGAMVPATHSRATNLDGEFIFILKVKTSPRERFVRLCHCVPRKR